LKCGGGEVHQVDEVDLDGMRRRERHRAKNPEGLISWRPALLKCHYRRDAHSIKEFCQELFGGSRHRHETDPRKNLQARRFHRHKENREKPWKESSVGPKSLDRSGANRQFV
jgi:hypothetical protein